MPSSIHPFLMFQDRQAEEAMRFYASLFADATILEVVHFGQEGPGVAGTLLRGRLSILGREILFFDSPVPHAFNFTPAWSFFVECQDETEIDRLYGALVDRGVALMGLGNHGFSQKFAWVNDRFGVSWQVNLA